ncbi:MAG: hypothetical protein HY851_10485 [candidate division Zixibacteria bacterium]|nr:hypothetical protein [candidate division Zixibacteria bacterium]
MIDTFRLRNLPPYAKTFVGIFTALMLVVCVWAVWIFSSRYGGVDQDNLPPYLRQNTNDLKADIDELKADSSAVMAPVWDQKQAGREQKIDSATLSAIEHRKLPKDVSRYEGGGDPDRDLGLAHTHQNGQTLLFFAIGLVFLFTSVKPKMKTLVYWIFGVTILLHTVGLTGRSYAPIFGDLLSFAGFAVLVVIAYMALMIFADLAKRPVDQQ